MKKIFRKYFPIYINTFNIFRPFRTWWNNKDIAKFPQCSIEFKKRNFRWLEENFYTWYWWDHLIYWNFDKKWILILIDDVFYKTTYGIIELQQVPFILIRVFNRNLIIKFNSPKNEDKYKYWEKMKPVLDDE